MQEKLPPSRGGTLKSMINKFKTHNKLSWEKKKVFVCSIGSSGGGVAPPPEPG